MSVLLYNETTSWQELAVMIHPTVSIVKDLNNKRTLGSLFSVSRLQGEDGFPGFKGDMGLKGDKVNRRLYREI